MKYFIFKIQAKYKMTAATLHDTLVNYCREVIAELVCMSYGRLSHITDSPEEESRFLKYVKIHNDIETALSAVIDDVVETDMLRDMNKLNEVEVEELFIRFVKFIGLYEIANLNDTYFNRLMNRWIKCLTNMKEHGVWIECDCGKTFLAYYSKEGTATCSRCDKIYHDEFKFTKSI